GVPSWSPNQLRHAAATEIREKLGLEVARIVLGHSSTSTTEIYAEIAARRVADDVGKIWE
ncbi:MAG: site-specific integrase, partial [Thermoguttaceae bacterium]|nr:site-specific integrase [Thermoguttaceae bacterium]